VDKIATLAPKMVIRYRFKGLILIVRHQAKGKSHTELTLCCQTAPTWSSSQSVLVYFMFVRLHVWHVDGARKWIAPIDRGIVLSS
jgi:hypothetical protein